MPFTNEVWKSPKWNGKKNPNQGWWNNAMEMVIAFIAKKIRRRIKVIELKDLATIIQNGLNALGSNVFKVFADMGEFQNYYKADNSNDITKYVNGILEVLSPSILPIKNLQVLTWSTRVTFVLDADMLNKDDDGNFLEVTEIRAVLQKIYGKQ